VRSRGIDKHSAKNDYSYRSDSRGGFENLFECQLDFLFLSSSSFLEELVEYSSELDSGKFGTVKGQEHPLSPEQLPVFVRTLNPTSRLTLIQEW
jgi:hypothetical protein